MTMANLELLEFACFQVELILYADACCRSISASAATLVIGR